jgi:hypothetical protein
LISPATSHWAKSRLYRLQIQVLRVSSSRVCHVARALQGLGTGWRGFATFWTPLNGRPYQRQTANHCRRRAVRCLSGTQ